MHECPLGCTSKNFNNILTVVWLPTTVVYIHIYTVTGTTWTCVYWEVAICACGADNIARFLLFLGNLLMFYQTFGVYFPFNIT